MTADEFLPRITILWLESWVGPVTEPRRYSKFTASAESTLELLRREAWYLGAKSITVFVDPESDMGDDQLDKRGAEVANPGAVVEFESRFGPLRYACDTYNQWQHPARGWVANVH